MNVPLHPPMRLGLIGFGQWGQRIMAALIDLDVIVWVCEPNAERRAEAIRLGATSVTDTTHDLSHCDGLIVATPAINHLAVLTSLTWFDKPIFVEKPLTTSYADAVTVSYLPLPPTFLMHIWRYHPGIVMLSELVRNHALGTLTALHTTRANWTSPRTDTDTAWTLLPHDLTIALAILGYFPEPRACLTECHQGTVRGLTALLGNVPAVVLNVSTRYADKRREVRLHGTTGVAVLASEQVDYIDIWWGDDQSRPDERQHERRYFDPTQPLKLELAAFLDYLRGGSPPVSSLQEGVEVVRLIEQTTHTFVALVTKNALTAR